MNKIRLILCSFIALALSACEKVIEIDLKNAKPIIVIEASVTDMLRSQKVKITQTKPFTEDNTEVPILDATITVKDLTLNKTYLFGRSDAEGNYSSEIFKGTPGNTYQLTVKSGSKEYVAKSTMPKKVVLDSLSVSEISFVGETRKYIKVHFADPAEFENQYRYILEINHKPAKGYFVDSDRFNNGKYVGNNIFTDDPKLKSGDEIKVEFQCIDMNIYRYFFSISQIAGNGGPPTAPSNPSSNFNNGALGYFSAHTSEFRSATVQ